MSRVLVLRLAGPMQSWGAASRFSRRTTEAFPTKSGIVGLLAAAEGRRRTDPIEDLASLTMAVRVDQPGELLRDFHTAHRGDVPMPLSQRYYIADAVFTALVEGPNELIDTLAGAIQNPVFPLYLGRRACPPVMPLVLEVHDGTIWDVSRRVQWQAARFYQRQRKRERRVELRFIADQGVIPAVESAHSLQDVPLSFDSERRLYGQRLVEETQIIVDNPEYQEGLELAVTTNDTHDPMEVIPCT
ncbi:type I-E CRISPR-associated protein Cas5/CasD [Schaalia suimastitidis]|uniref:type I-E CRISPR-associated protein Cas5/CasD n=1 Tax=Schaalia suimastitidis TaxID=121163 RepID=UPI0004795DF4|nr:type I-E CRISPR-associated protein Cas5/CasD [Schaalia suimastitidis]